MAAPSPERWRELTPYLNRALDVEGAEREALLREIASRDPLLAAELRELLAAEETLDRERFLETGLPSAELSHPGQSAGAGTTVGAYTLESTLGEGGMGTVWLARRSDGVYEGKAAVKLVRAGLDSKSILARFETERQTLARLNHAHIARVLDAGTTTEGRPYFAMEYVEGVSLLEYCDRHRLGLDARLELFLDVTAGVRHAHRNGIIHRDLKPGNILVTQQDGVPVPKIIDFGIAKAFGPHLDDSAQLTRQGDWIGTPAYMSPEQSGTTGGAVDTRADVYSLGVILHEMLSGVRPEEGVSLARRFASLDTGERQAIATQRDTDPAALERALEGDLTWIVMKAIEREPEGRYESVAALAQDVRAHLDDRPVEAGPPSVAYRARKFVARHRLSVVATAAVLLALIAGVAIAFAGYRHAIEAQRVAAGERDKAEAINAFMKETFASADPFGGSGREATIVDALGAAAKRLPAAFPDRPEIRAAVLQTIGDTYQRLGHSQEAEPLLVQALEIRRGLGTQAELDVAETLTSLGEGKMALSEDAQAEPMLREALAIVTRLDPDRENLLHARVLATAAELARSQSRDEAERGYESAVEAFRRVAGPDDDRTLSTATRYARLLVDRGDFEQGEAILRDVVERQKKLGPDDPRRAEGLSELAGLLDERSQLDEAERVQREALAIATRGLGDLHQHTNDYRMQLAWILSHGGRLDEAEALLREAVANNLAAGGSSLPRAGYLSDLAGVLSRAKKFDEAALAYEEALAILREASATHPWISITLTNLGVMKARAGQWAESEPYLREGLALTIASFGADSRHAAEVRENLANTLGGMKRWKEALAEGTLTVAVLSEKLGPDHESTLRSRVYRAMYLWRSGEAVDGERELRAVHEHTASKLGAEHPVTAAARRFLATLLTEADRMEEAAQFSSAPSR